MWLADAPSAQLVEGRVEIEDPVANPPAGDDGSGAPASALAVDVDTASAPMSRVDRVEDGLHLGHGRSSAVENGVADPDHVVVELLNEGPDGRRLHRCTQIDHASDAGAEQRAQSRAEAGSVASAWKRSGEKAARVGPVAVGQRTSEGVDHGRSQGVLFVLRPTVGMDRLSNRRDEKWGR